MKLRAWFVANALIALIVVSGCKSDSDNGGGAGGAGGAAGIAGAGGTTGGAGGSGGAAGTISGGAGGTTGGAGGTSGGAGGMTGGAGGMTGGNGGMTGGAGGTTGGAGGTTGGTGGTPDACEEATVPEDKCAVCEDDATCDAATYTDNGDDTVTSSCCGLVWQKTISEDQFAWAEAAPYCAGLALAGGGWRLPNKDELLSLVAEGMPPIDPVFTGAPQATFWSSTPVFNFPTLAWGIGFYNEVGGYAEGSDVGVTIRVRCVR